MRYAIPALVLAAGLTGVVVRFDTLGNRVRRLERTAHTEPPRLSRLASDLDELRTDVGAVRDRLSRERALEVFEDRLTQTETLLRASEVEMLQLGAAFSQRADASDQRGVERDAAFHRSLEAMRSELRELRLQLDERYGVVNEVATKAVETASAGVERMSALEATLPADRNRDSMWGNLVGPTVQLSGRSTVGSGVLIAGTDHTYVLTAWHVVRDITSEPDAEDEPIPVRIYAADGASQEFEAELLANDVDLDVAVLTLQDDTAQNCASLANVARMNDSRVFDRIYAVGCPLGNDPIPTFGEVASTSHRVGGNDYWMISAPTYIGNSGGGIFDAETHQLLGIFSKIYTHGSMRTTIVPHMGLVTPLDQIYAWMESEELGDLLPVLREEPGTTVAAER